MNEKSKIHEGKLQDIFCHVTERGATTVFASDLMRWMGWGKQVPGFWADVQERFTNALREDEREDGWRLFASQTDGFITLICLDKKDKEKEECWWTEVIDFANKPSPGRRKPVLVEE